MSNSRPHTTLFFPISVDGRITSHDSDELDTTPWKSNPKIRAALHPLVEFTNPNIPSVTSGEAMAKIGVNYRQGSAKKEAFQLIVIDDQHKLTPQGISYLSNVVTRLFFICTSDHPAINKPTTKDNQLITFSQSSNLEYLIFTHHIDLQRISSVLKAKYQFQKITVHSNVRYNARWLSLGLVDELSVIISPVLVGQHGTPNLIDTDLSEIVLVKLTDIKQFGIGFVNLRYTVINQQNSSPNR